MWWFYHSPNMFDVEGYIKLYDWACLDMVDSNFMQHHPFMDN